MEIKQRPALVIGLADSSDLTMLPVSRVSDKRRIDAKYDVMIDPAQYPTSGLTAVSYIRTNKVFTANAKEIGTVRCDLKAEYPDLYLDIMALFEEYIGYIMSNI